jgi:hypothetical protein
MEYIIHFNSNEDKVSFLKKYRADENVRLVEHCDYRRAEIFIDDSIIDTVFKDLKENFGLDYL